MSYDFHGDVNEQEKGSVVADLGLDAGATWKPWLKFKRQSRSTSLLRISEQAWHLRGDTHEVWTDLLVPRCLEFSESCTVFSFLFFLYLHLGRFSFSQVLAALSGADPFCSRPPESYSIVYVYVPTMGLPIQGHLSKIHLAYSNLQVPSG